VGGTHLWMGKSGREGIGARKQHSPRMGKSGKEGIRVSEQVALTKGWAREGEIRVSKGTHLGWASQGGRESE